jgi:hypothetical protein
MLPVAIKENLLLIIPLPIEYAHLNGKSPANSSDMGIFSENGRN